VRAGPSSDFARTAFEGSQFLDLDGFAPGAITQTFATWVAAYMHAINDVTSGY
jgi:hypothetical protein